MPRASGLSTKFTVYYQTVGVLGVLKGKASLSRRQARKRQQRGKQVVQWLDCPRSSLELEVPQTERQKLCAVGRRHLYCSRRKEYTNFNAVVNISLMPSQHPLSTSSFHQSPKFHLGTHVFPPSMSLGNNDWHKIGHVTWASPIWVSQVFGWDCWDKATFPSWWAWQRSSVSHLSNWKEPASDEKTIA